MYGDVCVVRMWGVDVVFVCGDVCEFVFVFFLEFIPMVDSQIFNYYSVIKAMGFTNHFPEQEMTCTAKLR